MTTAAEIKATQLPVAYFSMEIALDPAIPTYSGGLGILAGDMLRAAADLGVPMVAVTLLHRKGYFRQHLDSHGNQSETPYMWDPNQFLEALSPTVTVVIEGRQVQVKAWRYLLHGASAYDVPVYFLDTSAPENNSWDRGLTDYLYGGDERYRLAQEAILGLGGVAMLRALGYKDLLAYHMNEGHSALLSLALFEERMAGLGADKAGGAAEAVRQQCVFTTHTPVPAGQDQFPLDLVRRVLGEKRTRTLEMEQCCFVGTLNMSHLALFFSHHINGVAMRHAEISRSMFPSYPIDSITNGVHATTWTSLPFARLYDRYIPEWRRDNLYLRYAISIPLEEIRQAHTHAKAMLLGEIAGRTGIRLDPDVMTIGFARRAATYKRADLLFSDLDRLRRIAKEVGPLQVVYSGKAHPRDEGGKRLIRNIFQAAAALKDDVRVVYLEEYDMSLGKQICAGVDLWLNSPQKPQEASGTSGMKAALNGIPSLSVPDGWWVEGLVEGVTGWAIGECYQCESDTAQETASLYDKLEKVIMPMFYKEPEAYGEVMRYAIALNASYFNAQRMLLQYLDAYLRPQQPSSVLT
ncbi:MAG: alpha-glucan family phosphorylase [Chloroflexi bacterium]|nr:alpha-glucan family phosphorylase [Chloroflexota bacterium]